MRIIYIGQTYLILTARKKAIQVCLEAHTAETYLLASQSLVRVIFTKIFTFVLKSTSVLGIELDTLAFKALRYATR